MSVKKSLTVVQMYPDEMNIYGDRGNVLTIIRRLEWHGYDTELLYHHPRKPFPEQADIIIGGGGQDSGQDKVQNDLLNIGSALRKLADDDVPMLMVCGMYQMFGRFFKTREGKIIKGIEIFKAETYGSDTRMIGNITLNTKFGEVVGYENHSGKTRLDDLSTAFGKVISGDGNNGEDKTEGSVYKNVIGTYLHGSVLPKNPDFADGLIEQAAIRKYGEFEPGMIDDRFADTAHSIAVKRPR